MTGSSCALLSRVSRRAVRGWGVAAVAQDDSPLTQRQGFLVDAVGPVSAEPSWGRVLASTIRLRVQRLHQAGSGSRRAFRRRGRTRFRGNSRLLPTAWRLAGVSVVLAVVAGAAIWFAETAPHGTRPPSAASPGSGELDSASSQAQAAAWIASQVSSDATVACYPAMCAALQQQGVAAGRLVLLPPGSADPIDASVIVTSASAISQVGSDYAPALIASFGSGAARIEVRAVEPGGAAAYESALQADLAVRKSSGTELLRNWHIQFTAREAAQLRAGEVDSRLLATLAALASQYSFRVTTFGDASPGVQALFREATISPDGENRAAELAGAAALVNEQDPPFLPAHVAIGHPAAGQATLSIEFAAPSPLGLLSPALEVHRQRAAAGTNVILGALPLGWARIT